MMQASYANQPSDASGMPPQHESPRSMLQRNPNANTDASSGGHDAGDYDYPFPPQSSSSSSSASYLGSLCRRCCTFQNFCYIVQVVNCGLVCALIYLAILEYPKIEELEAQVERDKKEIAALSEEVREKQEGQIQDLHKAVQKEQQFNFLSLAGFFTLLTCLISMFHMTTHVHKMNQPKIQRKIIAILWMSPIYSVTSFVTLIFPSVEGWMAILKDFYESYCIFVFLSFLIAVLGEGSRERAVGVLAKHADHLGRPTRCLACFYEPPPDTSDHAKANAVMTQCQIYCLQFTLVRPLTSIYSVFVLHRKKKEGEEKYEEYSADGEFGDEPYGDGNYDNENFDGSGKSSSVNNSISHNATDQFSPADGTGTEDAPTPVFSSSLDDPTVSASASETAAADESTREEGPGGRMRRTLRKTHHKREQDYERWHDAPFGAGKRGLNSLLGDPGAANKRNSTINGRVNPVENTIENNDDDRAPTMEFPFPSVSPIEGGMDVPFPTFATGDGYPPVSAPTETPLTNYGTFEPTGFASLLADPGSVNHTAPSGMYDSKNTSGGIGHEVANVSGVTNISLSLVPTMAPSNANETTFDSTELVHQTKNYLKSPSFAVAMVVNVSIFFAFSGLLKLYHAVQKDLEWCRPFPKFLTIKAVVFLTFWQGLVITLWLVLTASPEEKEEALLEARKYQNLLICVEMLLVAICQWCVFPAIEWEPGYEPRQVHTPGLGIKDFVSDVGQIVNNRSKRTRIKLGKRRSRRKKYEGLDVQGDNVYSNGVDNFRDDAIGSSSFESDSDDEVDDVSMDDEYEYGGGTQALGYGSNYSDRYNDANHNGPLDRNNVVVDTQPFPPGDRRTAPAQHATVDEDTADEEALDGDKELI